MASRRPQPTPTQRADLADDDIGAPRRPRWSVSAITEVGAAREISPGAITSLTAVVAALRWGAAMIGLAWAFPRAADGVLGVVVTVAVAIFITSWRTVTPIRFAEPGAGQLVRAIVDVAALAIGIGLSDGINGTFVGSLFVAIAVASFGWGVEVGVASAIGAFGLAMTMSFFFGPQDGVQWPGPLAVTALAAAALLPGVALDRLADIEVRRRTLLDQRNRLAETNQLLAMLSDVARTLPSSLDLSDVIDGTRSQMIDAFDAKRLAILSYEDGTWAPLHQNGFDIEPAVTSSELPAPLDRAAFADDVVLVADPAATGTHRAIRIDDPDSIPPDDEPDHAEPRRHPHRSGPRPAPTVATGLEPRGGGSGLYTRLVVGGVDVGLIAIEHPNPGHFAIGDAQLLRGMADVLALTLSNARSFQRLRSLAAAEERNRIARDLHDRLGQYLTYIALELERINNDREQPSPELKGLHGEVQGAIAEFRDTLIELRAAVSAERPLTTVLSEVVDRFRSRSSATVDLTVPANLDRLPAIVENELLRIAQEALANIQKHSSATEVHVAWSIAEGCGVLVVQDDGRGFDPAKGIRGSAYGLVGMRERAASVGATLDIASEPGHGTVITVQTSQTSGQVTKP